MVFLAEGSWMCLLIATEIIFPAQIYSRRCRNNFLDTQKRSDWVTVMIYFSPIFWAGRFARSGDGQVSGIYLPGLVKDGWRLQPVSGLVCFEDPHNLEGLHINALTQIWQIQHQSRSFPWNPWISNCFFCMFIGALFHLSLTLPVVIGNDSV